MKEQKKITKSHIQMPKQILKNFQDENATVYYYDVQSKIIKKGRAKTLNREEGYYSNEIEDFLNKEIEDKLGKLIQYIINNTDIHGFCPVPPNFQKIVFNYMASLFSRSKKTVKDLVETFPKLRSLSDQEIHDFVAANGIDAVIETGVFDDFVPKVLYNISQEEFVLPLCGIYGYKTSSRCVLAPIRPDMAFVLLEKKLFENDKGEKCSTCFLVKKEEEMRFFNKKALRAQIKQNGGCVISRSSSLLKELIR